MNKTNRMLRIVKFIFQKYLAFFFLTGILYTKKGNSQITPAEGSKLNYRLVRFLVPEDKEVASYEFKIAKGDFNDESQFENNIIIVKQDTLNRTVIKLPSFGTQYTWQLNYRKGKKNIKGNLFHFSTDTSSFVDRKKNRLRILENHYKDSSLLFFMDYARVIVDMKGEPVWFLPDIDSVLTRNELPRDFKLTRDGTITFLTDFGAYEVDYQGELLWKAVGGKRGVGNVNREQGNNPAYRYYHHELYKGKNGHYFTLKDTTIKKQIPETAIADIEDFAGWEKIGDKYYMTIISASIVELDAKGQIVWESDLSKFIKIADIIPLLKEGIKKAPDMHANAFYFNEKDSIMYIGFKNTSQIYKITYPDNVFLGCYSGIAPDMLKLFSNQHSIIPTSDSTLCVFNNNIDGKRNDGVASSIVMLREPKDLGKRLVKSWEFSCDIDTFASAVSVRGGNVAQLSDGSFLVCMGTSNRVFIVNKQKDILFNSVCEFWFDERKIWTPFSLYRVTPINQEFLDIALLLTENR